MADAFESIQLDVDATVPLWRQLYSQLDELLTSGRVREGTSLPPERDLAETLGVSRSTIKRSYDQLRHDQRLTGRGRAGSVVRTPPSRGHVATGLLRGFTEEMRERGKVPSSRLLNLEVVRDAHVATIFRRPHGAQFLFVERVRSGDGMPIVREQAWYDLAVVPQMIGWDGTGSAFERLRRVAKVDIGSAEQTLEAVGSSHADAQAFGFASAQPCLLVKRLTRAMNGAPIEYLEMSFRGDAYAYRMDLLP